MISFKAVLKHRPLIEYNESIKSEKRAAKRPAMVCIRYENSLAKFQQLKIL